MEKHGYGSIPINTINPSYFDVHQGYKVLTQCHIRTWRGVSPIALCPENTVDCHVAPFYPNETPTFSSKATNRSSCGTAEVDFPLHSHWIPWRLHLFPFADCNSRHGSTRMQASHVRCGSSELEVMMHTCIHCLCWRAKASTNHKPPKATSARLFQLSSVDNSPEHFFGANSSELSPSPLCSACPFWICSRTHVAEALVASDILNLLMFRSVFQTMRHCNRDGVEPDTHNFPDFCMAQICSGAKHAETVRNPPAALATS